VRSKWGLILIAAAMIALVVPAASADVCSGPACGTGGGGSGSGISPFNHLSVSNGSASASTQPVFEDDTCFFHIHRSDPHGGNTSVHWHTKDGTATSQPESPPASTEGNQQGTSDYSAGSGIVTFSKEQPRDITISVQTNVDGPPTSDSEYFFVVIGRATNGVIVDNAGKCVILQGK
jgi:hypothetical protein